MKLRFRGYELIQDRPFSHNKYIKHSIQRVIVILNKLNDRMTSIGMYRIKPTALTRNSYIYSLRDLNPESAKCTYEDIFCVCILST